MKNGVRGQLKNLKLEDKLRLMNLLTGLAASLIAGAVLSVFVWRYETDSAIREAAVKGAIVAENVLPALQFRNPKTAQEILQGFSRDDTVLQARIVESDGEVFAVYRSGADIEQALGAPLDAAAGKHFCDDSLLRIPIRDGAELLGEIELRIDTGFVCGKIGLYMTAIGLATVASLLIGGYIVARLQRVITEPLTDLVRLMQSVSMEKRYWRRANIRSHDEIGALGSSFNQMIEQIQERDDALGKELAERQRGEAALLAAKAEADRANNAKSRFLAAASHDLRQPLSALNLYVEVLKRKVPAENQALVENMKNCVGSLSELLADLLDLSKLDAGVVTPNVADFPISELLANLLSIHAPEALLRGLRLRCVPSRTAACTDPVLFRRMLGNLIANAIRYTDRGGVLIGCRRRQGKVWVEVWDSGIGIPADKTGEIFEEFKQLDDARKRGSGLGLAIVAKTAALLGLAVRVQSWPGRGSMFAVEMPTGKPGRRLAAPAVAVKSRALRIALAEDNALVRQALECALAGVGHTVVAAATARELHARLEHCLPDIVISDYRLAGGETGFQVISSMRAKFGASLPAIIVTGDTDPELMRAMAGRGIVVQHKPLEIESLQACIASLVKAGAPAA